MTTTMSELEILEAIPTMDDNVSHWICAECYPGFTPGKIVRALCGALSEDCPEGFTDPDSKTCKPCNEAVDYECPVCGL